MMTPDLPPGVSPNWLQEIFAKLASVAAEHPLLIGLLLFGVVISTALHAFSFGGYLLLGLSRYLRGQVREIRHLKKLYKDEWTHWRAETADIFRFESMSAEEIEAELSSQGIDPVPTSDIVTAFARSWLARISKDKEQ